MKRSLMNMSAFVAAASVLGPLLFAQEEQPPVPAEMQKEIQKIMDNSFSQVKKEQIELPNNNMTSARCSVKPLNLDEILKEGPKSSCTKHEKGQGSQPQVLVFATLSMPDSSLKAYNLALQKIGGRLIIRGLVNDSFHDTQVRIQKLGIIAEIDPPLFDQFSVELAPTIILAEKRGDTYEAYDVVKGHISVESALEIFVRSGEISGAEKMLHRLRKDKA